VQVTFKSEDGPGVGSLMESLFVLESHRRTLDRVLENKQSSKGKNEGDDCVGDHGEGCYWVIQQVVKEGTEALFAQIYTL